MEPPPVPTFTQADSIAKLDLLQATAANMHLSDWLNIAETTGFDNDWAVLMNTLTTRLVVLRPFQNAPKGAPNPDDF